jgi:predicted anti-sigma-YlaC factor YlaD
MNCVDYQKLISRVVDLEVKATASGALFEHLGKCAQCREWLDTLLRMNVEYEKIQLTFETENEIRISLKPEMAAIPPLDQRFRQTRFAKMRAVMFFAALILVIGFVWSATLPNQPDYRLDLTKASSQTELLIPRR